MAGGLADAPSAVQPEVSILKELVWEEKKSESPGVGQQWGWRYAESSEQELGPAQGVASLG